MLRNKIFRVVLRGEEYFIRAFDGCAINTIGCQSGLPKFDSVERAPGKSKQAISMHDLKIIWWEKKREKRREYDRKRRKAKK
jgi:hypothetical protein